MRAVARTRHLVGLGMALALAACAGMRQAGEGAGGDAPPLAGTEWKMVALHGRPPVSIRDTPTVTFPEASRASGNGGCNQFNGPYTQDGDLLRFGPLVSTRRACVDNASNLQESSFLGALRSTRSFSISGDELVLQAYGREVLRLRRSGS